MTDHPAWYSIIRFCPNVARGEGVNVGVVLVSSSPAAVRIQFSANNERVKKQFGKTAFDDLRLTSSKQALSRRLTAILPTEHALRDFVGQESGSLVLDEPRAIVASEIDADIRTLFEELVGETPRRQRHRAGSPDIRQHFLPLFTANIPIHQDLTISVPKLGRKLHVPFAYRNGAMNYIKPQGFGPDEESTLKTAQNLGSQGYLIQKHPQGDIPEQLIVVGEFRERDHLSAVREMFDDFKVRLVLTDELQTFIDEIKQQAHD